MDDATKETRMIGDVNRDNAEDLVRNAVEPGAEPPEKKEITEEDLEKARLAGARLMAQTVTHELGTHLAVVNGYAELLGSGLIKPENMKDTFQEISGASDRLKDLMGLFRRINKIVTKRHGTSAAESTTTIDLKASTSPVESPTVERK